MNNDEHSLPNQGENPAPGRQVGMAFKWKVGGTMEAARNRLVHDWSDSINETYV